MRQHKLKQRPSKHCGAADGLLRLAAKVWLPGTTFPNMGGTSAPRWTARVVSLAFLFAIWRAAAQVICPVPYVIHVSMDAMAAYYLQDYVSNAPSQFPSFHRLMTEGAFTFNARCDYFDSQTTANQACMFTGRPALQPDGWPNTSPHGFTYNDPSPATTIHLSGNPRLSYQSSVFDVVHDHGLSTAFLASKVKLRTFTNSWNAANGAPDLVGEDNGRNKIDFAMITDALTNPPTYVASEPLVNELLARLTNSPWNYTFLHFEETDYVGHYFGWGSESWSAAARHVDGQLGRILAAIDATAGLSNRIALVVTADHGGGGDKELYGYNSHGAQFHPYNYTTPFFVWGPGIPGGTNLYALMANRGDPGGAYLDYNAIPQPLRSGDSGNLALALLGLPPVPGSTLMPRLSSLRYPISVQRSEAGLTVAWPAGADGYELEWRESLDSNVSWKPVTGGTSIQGNRKLQHLSPPIADKARFFRLRQP